MSSPRFLRVAAREAAGPARDGPHTDPPLFVEETFEAWYRRIWPKLVAYTTAQSGGRLDVGREAAAAAAAKAYEAWGSDRIRDPNVWVYTVALNEMRRTFRRRKLELKAATRASDIRAVGPPEVPDMRLSTAVAALPKRQRVAIVLRYECDLSQAQIAEVMRIAPGTVAALLSTARKQLRTTLEQQHGTGDE